MTFQNAHTQLIFDMFIDNEDTVEVEQQVNKDSSENTMQGIALFKVHIHIFTTKHVCQLDKFILDTL